MDGIRDCTRDFQRPARWPRLPMSFCPPLPLRFFPPNGLVFRRTVSLPERGTRIAFSSFLENGAKESRTCRLVCRVEFARGAGKSVLTALGEDGAFRAAIPTEAKDAQWPYPLTNERYDGPNTPAGAWRLANLSGGFVVEGRFSPNEIASLNMIRASSEGIGDIVELHTPEREVHAGSERDIHHRETPHVPPRNALLPRPHRDRDHRVHARVVACGGNLWAKAPQIMQRIIGGPLG